MMAIQSTTTQATRERTSFRVLERDQCMRSMSTLFCYYPLFLSFFKYNFVGYCQERERGGGIRWYRGQISLFGLILFIRLVSNAESPKWENKTSERGERSFWASWWKKKNEFLVMHASELQTRAKEKKKKKNHKSNICAIVDAVI